MNSVWFMSVIFTNGYALDNFGPFLGNESDARITESAMKMKLGSQRLQWK